MRHYPEEDSDRSDLEELNVEPWMVEQLKLNPHYVFWGPHEDYMWTKEGEEGWHSRILKDGWKELGLELDELNEIVHFYFSLGRDNKQCSTCGGSGYHPDAQWISESFYKHSSPFLVQSSYDQMFEHALKTRIGLQLLDPVVGRGVFPSEELLTKYGPAFRAFCEEMRNGDGFWNDKITQDELDALFESNRVSEYNRELKRWEPCNVTVEQVNAAQRGGRGTPGMMLGHDAINRGILVEQRCKRLGVPTRCTTCGGNGYVYTTEKGHLCLTLWLIHPRKGASRGVEVKNIQKEDLQEIYNFLTDAAQRNAERFSKVVPLSTKDVQA